MISYDIVSYIISYIISYHIISYHINHIFIILIILYYIIFIILYYIILYYIILYYINGHWNALQRPSSIKFLLSQFAEHKSVYSNKSIKPKFTSRDFFMEISQRGLDGKKIIPRPWRQAGIDESPNMMRLHVGLNENALYASHNWWETLHLIIYKQLNRCFVPQNFRIAKKSGKYDSAFLCNYKTLQTVETKIRS